MNRHALLEMLEQDEGLRLRPYRDTVGKLTIGIGRNLDDRGITKAEALYLCENDIAAAEGELDKSMPWWRELTEARQQVLCSMVFNLGWPKLAQFLKFRAALTRNDWAGAAAEMRDSLWYSQVKARGERLARMMEKG